MEIHVVVRPTLGSGTIMAQLPRPELIHEVKYFYNRFPVTYILYGDDSEFPAYTTPCCADARHVDIALFEQWVHASCESTKGEHGGIHKRAFRAIVDCALDTLCKKRKPRATTATTDTLCDSNS